MVTVYASCIKESYSQPVSMIFVQKTYCYWSAWIHTKPGRWAVMYMCFRGIHLTSFCEFSIGFWNFSDIVVFFVFHSIQSDKVKHHLTCFNNIFSNNELISNRFAVFVTCTHILTYLSNRLLIDFYLCVYDRVCKVPRVLFNICVCERKLIFFV
jgi:hypothetical protein